MNLQFLTSYGTIFCVCMLGMEPRASWMIIVRHTTELYPQLQHHLF
jgi:hypothetical protein